MLTIKGLQTLKEQIDEIYFNTEQIKAFHLGATETFFVAGRAFGKTTHILAPALYRILQQMPQSMIAVVGASYAQLVERVLPALIFQGLGHLGLQEESHYFIGRYAPKSLNWKKPFRHPIDPKHIVHFFQGSCLALVSMDRPNLSNGYEFDAALGDEARLLKSEELQQFFQTIRGNESKWGHLAVHQSKIFTTDFPTQINGRWILEKEKKSLSEELQKLILHLAGLQSELHARSLKATNPAYKSQLAQQIQQIEKILNKLRKNTLYFKNVSTLENAFVLGTNTIKSFMNNLTEFNYDVSVLGVATNKVDGGFYSQLSEQNVLRAIETNNYDYIDTLDYSKGDLKRDCRWDSIFKREQAIYLGIDCNAAFNTCVVAQIVDDQILIQNNLWLIKKPIKFLAKKFADYYKYTRNKTVVLIYNYTFAQNSAINVSADEDGYTNYFLEWELALRENGFNVIPEKLDNLEEHSIRRSRAERSFLGEGRYQIKINQETCDDLITALEQAEIKVVEGREKKNKDYEKLRKDKNGDWQFQKPPQHDTHSTDAFDDVLRYLQSFDDIF